MNERKSPQEARKPSWRTVSEALRHHRGEEEERVTTLVQYGVFPVEAMRSLDARGVSKHVRVQSGLRASRHGRRELG